MYIPIKCKAIEEPNCWSTGVQFSVRDGLEIIYKLHHCIIVLSIKKHLCQLHAYFSHSLLSSHNLPYFLIFTIFFLYFVCVLNPFSGSNLSSHSPHVLTHMIFHTLEYSSFILRETIWLPILQIHIPESPAVTAAC